VNSIPNGGTLALKGGIVAFVREPTDEEWAEMRPLSGNDRLHQWMNPTGNRTKLNKPPLIIVHTAKIANVEKGRNYLSTKKLTLVQKSGSMPLERKSLEDVMAAFNNARTGVYKRPVYPVAWMNPMDDITGVPKTVTVGSFVAKNPPKVPSRFSSYFGLAFHSWISFVTAF
jgi:hypothetical protein